MKRRKLVVILLVIITLSSPFLFDYILKAKRNHFIKDTFGFNKKEFKVLKETDSHRGFHGDGDYVLILDCSENKEKALEYTKEWEILPLTENLQLLMYGGEKEDHFYNYNLADASNIPEIKNGYYYFYDRHANSKDTKDDTNIFRGSFNFSLALYDLDTDIMYLLEFDT